MENKENILKSDFLEILWYVINDIFILSKEFSWALSWDIKEWSEKHKVRVLENKDSKFKKLNCYFIKEEIDLYYTELTQTLDNLLVELEKMSKEINLIDDEKKEKIVTFIKSEIEKLSAWASFNFPQRFRDMLFIELWLDHIDDIWEAKEIANLAISKVMLMSR